ncbi:hypothetical protein BBF96_04035 [Anoxybacter fermentans]|uniref:Uncharacterized protein n=1 Tax=Anoxybacter fermentans TaxID=1323375 RepID=A0A3S9SWG6_9FIRM|nr:hypothetical protein [Anoxybacter fermentans]AZR72629.1 hypothetical protein BBF96_04035 [Anoxybacter fermentans]
MEQKQREERMIKLTIHVPEKLASGIETISKLKNLSQESLLRIWVEEGLEREELRFERLLLFAEMTGELDDKSIELLSRLKTRYFDEKSDGERGLDPYMLKSISLNHLYNAISQENSL